MYKDRWCNCCFTESSTYYRESTKTFAPYCTECIGKYSAVERKKRIHDNMFNRGIETIKQSSDITNNVKKLNKLEGGI